MIEKMRENLRAALPVGDSTTLDSLLYQHADAAEAYQVAEPGSSRERDSLTLLHAAADAIRNYVASLRAAPVPVAGWRPIETAPKDGSCMLLLAGDTVTMGGWTTDMDAGADYEGQLKVACWWSYDGINDPTHWMPLPAVPTPTQEEPTNG